MLGANIGFADVLSASTNDGASRLRRLSVSPPLQVAAHGDCQVYFTFE
jgi:hypothetical protein